MNCILSKKNDLAHTEYKGIYHNVTLENKCFDPATGAHFRYEIMCSLLLKLKRKLDLENSMIKLSTPRPCSTVLNSCSNSLRPATNLVKRKLTFESHDDASTRKRKCIDNNIIHGKLVNADAKDKENYCLRVQRL